MCSSGNRTHDLSSASLALYLCTSAICDCDETTFILIVKNKITWKYDMSQEFPWPSLITKTWKIENESNKFLNDNLDFNVMLEVGREKDSLYIKEVSPDLSDTSWCTISTSSSWINPHEMGNTTTKINYNALLVELDQEEIESYKKLTLLVLD